MSAAAEPDGQEEPGSAAGSEGRTPMSTVGSLNRSRWWR